MKVIQRWASYVWLFWAANFLLALAGYGPGDNLPWFLLWAFLFNAVAYAFAALYEHDMEKMKGEYDEIRKEAESRRDSIWDRRP